jgi:serine phosphatase RsbU (regulator of sigma subunit)/PAS domain-containing protein
VTADERRAVIYGLIVSAGFVAIDIALGDRAAISGSYAFGAIVAGVLGGFRPSVIAGLAALGLALASGVWNDDFGESGYLARLFVAGCGSLIALGAGRLRDEVGDQLDRQAMLLAAAGLPEPGESLEQTVERVTEMLVPRFARFAAIDAELPDGQLRLGSSGMEVAGVVATHLRARGRVLGTLSIGGGRAGADDPEFLRVFGGRVALALDNAGLSQELVTVEQQLQAILENLGEAVTVQDRSGRLVFANSAAAELLGAGTVDDLLATPPEELVTRFTTVNEDGSPLDGTRLPGRVVLAGGEAEPLVVRVTDNQTGEEHWRMTKSTAVRGIAGEVVLAVNVIEDITDAKRAELAQRLLSDASAVLASSLDYRETLQQVADLAVDGVADWCAVSAPGGELVEPIAAAGEVPAESGDTIAAVLRSGQPLLEPSLLAVPIATPERTVGALALGTSSPSRRFGELDLELALELGRRAATAVENARLYTQLEHVANTLQRSLLPPELPNADGWSFHSLYLPAAGETEVGGDFYDVFPTAAGWMGVMGDVVGRGATAASLTAMARYTLRTAGSLVGTPTMGLARLNENLRERGEMALCTACVVLLREADSQATLVCAGHPLPYLIRGGHAQQVGRIGPLLGAFDHGHWLAASLELEPGDVLVLYTDGVLDARGSDSRFGEERLEATLAGATSAEDACARIQTALLEFAGSEQDDDTAVLALQKL